MTSNNRHKWLVLTASFCVSFIAFGNELGFGVFFTSLLETFGRSRSVTSTVHAIFRGLTGLFGICSGLITARMGVARTALLGGMLLSLGYITSYFASSVAALCVTIGVLGGVGNSLLFNACTTAVGQSFSGTKRRFALGLQNIGINIGGMVFPFIFNMLLIQVGLKGSFLITGSITLNTLAASVIFSFDRKQSDSMVNKTTNSEMNSSYATNCKERCTYCFMDWMDGTILLIMIGTSAGLASLKSFLGFVVDVFIWKGAPQAAGITCITVVNSVALVSRLLMPLTKRFFKDTWAIAHLMGYCILSIAGICIITLVNTPEVMLVGGALIGVPFGAMMLAGMVFIMDNVPKSRISVAMGVLHSWIGIMAVTTGPLFGSLYDWTSSYQSVSVVVGCLQVFSFLVFLLALLLRLHRQREKVDHTVSDTTKDNPPTSQSDTLV